MVSDAYLALFANESDVEIQAHSLGVADEGAHIDILRPAFRAAELGRTGADLFRKFSLREALLLPLIGKLEADPEDPGLLLECLPNPWIGKLVVKITVL